MRWASLLICGCLLLTGCGGGSAEERTAAEMLLKLGATINVSTAQIPVKTAAKLPPKPLITAIKLQGKTLTVADLEPFKPLKAVEELTLSTCQMPYEICPIISGYTRLKSLDLYKTTFNDDAVAQLSNLSQLTKLELSYTRITDKSIDKLLEFKRLEQLYITGTRITPEGLKRLREGLPGCVIQK